jgi:hypothetical protein
MAGLFYRLLVAFFVGIPVVALLLALGVPVSGVGLYAGLFGGVAASYVPGLIDRALDGVVDWVVHG